MKHKYTKKDSLDEDKLEKSLSKLKAMFGSHMWPKKAIIKAVLESQTAFLRSMPNNQLLICLNR